MDVSLEGQMQDSIFSQALTEWHALIWVMGVWTEHYSLIDPVLPGLCSQSKLIDDSVPPPQLSILIWYRAARCCWAAEEGFQRSTPNTWPTSVFHSLDLSEDNTVEKPVGVRSCGVSACAHQRVQILRVTPSRFSIIIRLLGEQCQEGCTDLYLGSALHRRGVQEQTVHTRYPLQCLTVCSIISKGRENHKGSLYVSEQMYCRIPLWAAGATSLLSS